MARYVITGGSGFIGSALRDYAETLGHEVIVASRGIHNPSETDWVEYDFGRSETIANITALQPDGVFHLAWSTVPSSADQAPGADIRTNLAGTIELFRELARIGCRTVFLSSGGTVYGLADTVPIPETHPLKPIGFYGMAKAAAENYADLLYRTAGYDVRIARLSNPYGPHHRDSKAQGVASIFARRIIQGDEIILMGDGKVVRDYLDVEEAASAIFGIMSAEPFFPGMQPVFNVGSGEGLSVLDIVHTIADASGRTPTIRWREGRSFDVPVNVLDIRKIKHATGWHPTIDARSGISRLVRRLQEETD